jgi:hypothetical protein
VQMVVPEMERHGPIEAWIIGDTGFVTPWLWVHRERCQHRSPAPLVPLIIRWGLTLRATYCAVPPAVRNAAARARPFKYRVGWTAGTGTRVAGTGRIAPFNAGL